MARAVRLADVADVAAIARANQPVQQLHARLYPDLFKPVADQDAVASFFAKTITTPSNEIALCEDNGTLLGYIWTEQQRRPETPFTVATSRLYVHHISVAEHARRQGVASTMLDWVTQRARGAGIAAFVLDYWAANDEARAFFGRHGFEPERVGMRKVLE